MAKDQELKPGPLDGMTRKESTFIGGKYVSDLKTLPKDDAEYKEALENARKRFTLFVTFDFSNVSADEICDQLASTTSFMKMLQNNVLKHWTEDEAATFCADPYPCSIRELLDNRKTLRALSDEEKIKRSFINMKKNGATKEQLMELINAMDE